MSSFGIIPATPRRTFRDGATLYLFHCPHCCEHHLVVIDPAILPPSRRIANYVYCMRGRKRLILEFRPLLPYVAGCRSALARAGGAIYPAPMLPTDADGACHAND